MYIRTRRIIWLMFSAITPCFAAGGTGEYELPWPHPNEALMYHACGCADSCWVAEVRDRKTNKVLNRLSCDCTSLSFSKNGRKQNVPIDESCDEINRSRDKAELIKNKIEQLRKSAAQNKRKQ